MKFHPETLEYLLQLDIIDKLPSVGKDQWQTLYLGQHTPAHRIGIYCALLDDDAAGRALERDGWDITIGDGAPGFSSGWADGKETTTYERPSDVDGIRRLILYREFYGAFPDYLEIDEEFRLYHNLADDRSRGLLLDFDRSGREIEVARIDPKSVQVKLRYLRQFQAGTGLHLAIYMDSVRYSTIPLASIASAECDRTEINGCIRWRRNVTKCDFNKAYQTFSRLLCKVVLAPPARERSGIWPYKVDESDKPVTFKIAVDEFGNDVESTCDPDELSNYFGSNPGAPHYLTPVFFRREVLTKYFAEPDRYKVSDGRLSCLALWSCQIDNDLDSHVVVFLGDLGRDLPYEERLHWRQFNIAPEGQISETNYRRSFLSQFADAQAADLSFREEYASVLRDWGKVQGWPLFLPLSQGDSHLLETVRVPVTNSQVEFDEQIGHLTKLLIDSLNEKEIAVRAGALPENAKGITKLATFLEATKFPESQSTVQLLRDLQSLRSTGTAHRKGSEYEKIITKLGVDPNDKADAVRRFLIAATQALRAIRRYYCRASAE